MYGDFLRILLKDDEPVKAVENRLLEKNQLDFEWRKSEIQQQAALCAELLQSLQAPQDTARYQFASLYLKEAESLESCKDTARQEHEKRRAALEAEYFSRLQARLAAEQARKR